MKFFYKMERKFGRYAIHNLMNYIVALYLAGFLIQQMNPGFYWDYLSLNPVALAHGQIWRIVTFLVYPPSTNMIGALLMAFLYFSIGNTLERTWGAFRFNVYFFLGVLGHVIGALVGYLLFHQVWYLTAEYLNLSLFLAFAVTYPNLEFLLYFVIPIKAKWLGLVYALGVIWSFISGNMSTKSAIVLSLINFLIFFFMTRNYAKVNPKEIKRKRDFHNQVKVKPRGGSHHKCAICGRTELDGEHLEFRYCSKCEGNYEYCQDHLYTHRHVTSQDIDGGQDN